MKNVILKTKVLICILILVGFMINAWLNYATSINGYTEEIEHVSTLTSEGIYYRIKTLFTKPINVSLTMANDNLLKSLLLTESENLNSEEYVNIIKDYLDEYREKYSYDSVFLVSEASGKYYNFNGVNRVLKEDNPENEWYYYFLNLEDDYTVNIDNDEAAKNEITVFINCRIKDDSGATIGVVGVGVNIESLQELLAGYEQEFGVETYLIDTNGKIEISNTQTGYQDVSLFDFCDYPEMKNKILDNPDENRQFSNWHTNSNKKVYVVSQYIPELSWHLIVENDTSEFIEQTNQQLLKMLLVAMCVVIGTMLIVAHIIKRYNGELVTMTTMFEREKSEAFRKATEQLYDNIYEVNITRNCASAEKTEAFFESIGISRKAPLEEALNAVARRQIKEEFREGYLERFLPENVMQEYSNGNTKISYEFQMKTEEERYEWISIQGHIYYSPVDDCIYMLTYRKNIDAEKYQEMKMLKMIKMDAMTRVYNKTTTQYSINEVILENEKQIYAFFIFDIDNFKNVNDNYGHAFGDFVIIEFANMLKQNFNKESDIVGRIGGDEFVVLTVVRDEEDARNKARNISGKLSMECKKDKLVCKISSSIGVALSPMHGSDYETLYHNADIALYKTKENGKNGFTFCKNK